MNSRTKFSLESEIGKFSEKTLNKPSCVLFLQVFPIGKSLQKTLIARQGNQDNLILDLIEEKLFFLIDF